MGGNNAIEWIKPDENPRYRPYDAVIKKNLHPTVKKFFSMGHDALIEIALQKNPKIDPVALKKILTSPTRHFHWAGGDLLHVKNQNKERSMLLLEINSCPSGQKSMPVSDHDFYAGYKKLLEKSFLPKIGGENPAVIFDKNYLENLAYAEMLARLLNKAVPLLSLEKKEKINIRFTQNSIQIADPDTGQSAEFDSVFRYVTQSPWQLIPVDAEKFVYNPISTCLAGGRNKFTAALAFENFNRKNLTHGFKLCFIETTKPLSQQQTEEYLQKNGGVGVIKNPYSNAGQGVWTILTPFDLNEWRQETKKTDFFIIQPMVGYTALENDHRHFKYQSIGTKGDDNSSYVFDLRLIASSGSEGFFPLSIYARRARRSMDSAPGESEGSWNYLGTNLTFVTEQGDWDTDTSRLIPLDEIGFNCLQLDLADLVEAYLQTVFAMVAVDDLAHEMFEKSGTFDREKYGLICQDSKLSGDIL